MVEIEYTEDPVDGAGEGEIFRRWVTKTSNLKFSRFASLRCIYVQYLGRIYAFKVTLFSFVAIFFINLHFENAASRNASLRA